MGVRVIPGFRQDTSDLRARARGCPAIRSRRPHLRRARARGSFPADRRLARRARDFMQAGRAWMKSLAPFDAAAQLRIVRTSLRTRYSKLSAPVAFRPDGALRVALRAQHVDVDLSH